MTYDETTFALSELPSGLASALESSGYRRRDISVRFAEESRLGGCYTRGNRAEAFLVNLETGQRTDTARGSWGGSNGFVTTRVDDDDKRYPIPPDVALVTGERGGVGGKSGFFHVVLNPAHKAKLLASPDSEAVLTKAEGIALRALCSFNSSGRKRAREEYGLTNMHFDGLVANGFAKKNKAGHFSATTEGKRRDETNTDIPRHI